MINPSTRDESDPNYASSLSELDTKTTGKTILVADDDKAIRFVLEQALSRAGYQVAAFPDSRGLLDHLTRHGGDLVITDIVMPNGSGLDLLKEIKAGHPDLPVLVITAQSTLSNAVNAFEGGAFEYLSKPFDITKLVDLVKRALTRTKASPKQRSRRVVESDRSHGFIGSSRAVQELFRTIGRLSNTEMTVLIHGESGTGKELVARAVHAYSPRRSGPFTAINMAAIPRDLIESELFGHEKGAFTGAVTRRPGHFERAESGTLFLDEIGDMPMDAQTRLLRVLQEGTYTRIGGTETLRGNVRIIAATHQDLPAAITEGRFREDLFYRLNVIPLHVPSLRSRTEDIPLLVEHFIAKAARELALPPKRFSGEAMQRMLGHDWPGNVRELENLVHRLMVLVPDENIAADRILFSGPQRRTQPESSETSTQSQPISANEPPSIKQAILFELDRFFSTLDGLEATGLHAAILRQVEHAMIGRVLTETRGNRLKAASVLGINRNTLRKKMADLGLEPKNSRSKR
ncbi:MAG: nitrogen regulation protein NR(I) [Magnetococcales bacterium]|nr:nitrogen regulation protein NR(I) [Magnetococcales bacterium]